MMCNSNYLNKIINCDAIKHIPLLETESVDLFLSDIPYGINLDTWDVLHNNKNSALLGKSPAQNNKDIFKRRGKPINGWSKNDKNIGNEYKIWCDKWTKNVFNVMREGSTVFIFSSRRYLHKVISSFEESGFILKDILMWEKDSAYHRAQRLSIVLSKRGLSEETKYWDGWRLGNLAPIIEPIIWLIKPYRTTITDNVLYNKLGAFNSKMCEKYGSNKTNKLKFGFIDKKFKIHDAQKPLKMIKFLIELVTVKNQVVLDPFIGSGTTAIAATQLNRNFIGFENNKKYYIKSLKRLYVNKYNKEEE